jgi:hypothetical protein
LRVKALGWLALVACVVACGPVETAPTTDAGCPNDLPKACPSSAPVYADVEPIVAARCASCHGPGGTEASIPLTSYAAISARKTTVLAQIYGCRMPPASAEALTADERATLLAWFVCGAPEK